MKDLQSVVQSTNKQTNDDKLFQDLIEAPRVTKRGSDGDSAFSKFKDFTHKMLAVAIKKGMKQLLVGRLVQGGVDAGIFGDVVPEQRYRRAYNYFVQQQGDLPVGWKVQKLNKKNHLVHVA